MAQFNKKLVDKYLADQVTPDEARQVLAWLSTPEGEAYVARHIDHTLDKPMPTTPADEVRMQKQWATLH